MVIPALYSTEKGYWGNFWEGFTRPIKSLIPGYASGTDFHPGGLAWVGEQGKELVNMPRGSQVIPQNGIGNNVNINITGNNISSDYDVDRIGDKLVRRLYREGVIAR